MTTLGTTLLLYPTAGDFVKNEKYKKAISKYEQIVNGLDADACEKILTDAIEYNIQRSSDETPTLSMSQDEWEMYENTLNIPGTDVIGYIEIPKVAISLPIYHNATAEVMERGVGHIEGSSLPVGGENTHSILIAHRGLSGDKLFTDVGELTFGDTFTLYVLNETLTYEVDRIMTVEPSIPDELEIEEDMDFCTLVTCTPYGVNTHRLMVRGHRIETPESYPRVDTFHIGIVSLIVMVTVDSAAIIALMIICLFIFHAVKKRKRLVLPHENSV